MNYEEFFQEIKERFAGTDVSDIAEHLAYQFTIEDAQAGGVFYVEVKEGKLYIEPYDYHDRDAGFTCTPDTLRKLIDGKLDPVAAFTMRKLKVDGSIEKALRLKDLIAKIKACAAELFRHKRGLPHFALNISVNAAAPFLPGSD